MCGRRATAVKIVIIATVMATQAAYIPYRLARQRQIKRCLITWNNARPLWPLHTRIVQFN